MSGLYENHDDDKDDDKDEDDFEGEDGKGLPVPPTVVIGPSLPLVKLPLVALVGRPNVGKSSLFNRLIGERLALVHDQPGVTRDRLFGKAEHNGHVFRVVDTGGLELGTEDAMLSAMMTQTQLAIDAADLVLFVVDGREGVTAQDHAVAKHLRKAGVKVIVIVNKLDTIRSADDRADAYALGFDTVVDVSAEHGRNFSGLTEAILEQIDAPKSELAEESLGPIPVEEDDGGETSRVEWKGGPIRVAVVGRPNVGKSTMVNALLGEERLLATPIAGTTRDAVDTDLERDGQAFVLVDTAGVRRKAQIHDKLEHFAVVMSLRSVDRADVVLLVLDGTERISQQDARLAAHAHEAGKGIIVVVNKWDLIENDEWKEKYPKAYAVDLPFLTYVPVIYASAKTGRGLGRLLDRVVTVQKERHRRIGTGELNRFFEAVVERNPPTGTKGKRAKIFFVSQPLVRPPTFIFTTGNPDLIPTTYARFLRNSLRDRYGFEGTPIWLRFRPRGKKKGLEPGSKLTD